MRGFPSGLPLGGEQKVERDSRKPDFADCCFLVTFTSVRSLWSAASAPWLSEVIHANRSLLSGPGPAR